MPRGRGTGGMGRVQGELDRGHGLGLLRDRKDKAGTGMQRMPQRGRCRRTGSHQDLPHAINTIRQRILVSVLRMTNKKIAIQNPQPFVPG